MIAVPLLAIQGLSQQYTAPSWDSIKVVKYEPFMRLPMKHLNFQQKVVRAVSKRDVFQGFSFQLRIIYTSQQVFIFLISIILT